MASGVSDGKIRAFVNNGAGFMLATSFAARTHDPKGMWMSEKLDGVRALWDGQCFFTRNGNKLEAPNFVTAKLPNTVLDGELWTRRGGLIGTSSHSIVIRLPNSSEEGRLKNQLT